MASKIALKNVRVFDGSEFGQPTTVYINGSTIGEGPSPDQSTTTTTIDAGGRYLIPGLIDSHIHISDVTGLESLTSYGVTTALNMACRDYAVCDSLRGREGLADFLSAGVPAIGVGSGHARALKPPPEQLLAPTDDPETVVSTAFDNGADYYKIVAQSDGPSQEMQNALVNAAHKLGKQVMTHASSVDSYLQAIASHTDVIQHTPSDSKLPPDAISRILSQGQAVTPTMNFFKFSFDNPAIFQVLRGRAETNDSYDNVVSNVAALREAGVTVLAGTDAVGKFVGGIVVPFGKSLHSELQHLVSAGYSPAEALRAATSIPARVHRLHDRGVVAPGKRADLVLLNKDPLVDISNTTDISRVWVGGVEFSAVATS